MKERQPTPTTPEANSETSSLTGVTGFQPANSATIGSTETLTQPENGVGFVPEACGTCQTQHPSHHIHEEPTVRSEVPPVYADGTGTVSVKSGGASEGTQHHEGTEADPLRSGPKRIHRRARKAHWKAVIGEVEWRFSYDPESNVIVIRKRGTPRRKHRTITMPELLELLGGQRILHL